MRTVAKRPCTIEERGGALRHHPDRATGRLRCAVSSSVSVRISGDEAGGTGCWGLGGVGVGGAGLGVEALSLAGVSATTVAVVGERSVPALAVVAVRLRCRRRRRFPAVVVDEEAVGRLQKTEHLQTRGMAKRQTCFKTTSQTALVER